MASIARRSLVNAARPAVFGNAFRTSVRTKVTEATSVWKGTLKEGNGVMSVGSGAFKDLPFSHGSRFGGDDSITNPEELIGAAQSGCFSMFLGALLTKKGLTPDSITTVAKVTLGEGPTVTSIAMRCECAVKGISAADFAELAAEAKRACPISKALNAVSEITLDAKLLE